MIRTALLLTWLCLAIPLAALAAPADDEARIQHCLGEAAARFDVDLVALQLIREIEGGQLGSASANANGTFDLGPMQINTIWVPAVERAGGSLTLLRDDPCVNAFVAAWIFSQEVATAGSTAQAIARYHSRTPEFQARYLARALTIVRHQIAREVGVPSPGKD